MDRYILAVLMDFIGLRSGKQRCMIYCERQAICNVLFLTKYTMAWRITWTTALQGLPGLTECKTVKLHVIIPP